MEVKVRTGVWSVASELQRPTQAPSAVLNQGAVPDVKATRADGPEVWWAGLTTDELWAEICRRADAAEITEEDVDQEVEAYRAGR